MNSTTVTPTALSHGDALSLLLGAEGFLLAAVAVAVTLAAPNQPRQPKHKALTAGRIMSGAIALMIVLAIGAVFAWVGLCRDGSFHGGADKIVGGSLLVASVGMPTVAWALVLGARRA